MTMANSVQREDEYITELRAAFNFYGATDDRLDLPCNDQILKKMMEEGDLAGAGYIDFPAFVTMMTKNLEKSSNESTLKSAFEFFDPHKTGEIEKNEMHALLTTTGNKLTQDEWKVLEKVADPENSGIFRYDLVLKEIFGAKSNGAT